MSAYTEKLEAVLARILDCVEPDSPRTIVTDEGETFTIPAALADALDDAESLMYDDLDPDEIDELLSEEDD